MSGIQTFGIEWETKLVVFNPHNDLISKVPYPLMDGIPEIQYSLEEFHPVPYKQVERRVRPEIYNPYCLFSLEFILGVFTSQEKWNLVCTKFVQLLMSRLCRHFGEPMLPITNANDEVSERMILAIVDYPDDGPVPPDGRSGRIYTDCSLNHLKTQGAPPPNNIGVRYTNQCPIIGNPQISIGVDLLGTCRLFANEVRSDFIQLPPGYNEDQLAYATKQNFRESAFKMTSNFLFNYIKPAGDGTDAKLNTICFEMVLAIVIEFRSRSFDRPDLSTPIDYLKQLFPIKPRTNLSFLMRELDEEQQTSFSKWYRDNHFFLKDYWPLINGYWFRKDYPKLNISKMRIYSDQIESGIEGVKDISIEGDSITYSFKNQNEKIANAMEMQPIQALVFHGQVTKIRGIFNHDNSGLIFEGVGHASYDATDINEWAHEEQYNILEIRNLSKYTGENIDIVSIELGQLKNFVDVCVTNINTICTTGGVDLALSPEEWEAYINLYRAQINASKTEAAMRQLIDDFELKQVSDGLED